MTPLLAWLVAHPQVTGVTVEAAALVEVGPLCMDEVRCDTDALAAEVDGLLVEGARVWTVGASPRVLWAREGDRTWFAVEDGQGWVPGAAPLAWAPEGAGIARTVEGLAVADCPRCWLMLWTEGKAGRLWSVRHRVAWLRIDAAGAHAQLVDAGASGGRTGDPPTGAWLCPVVVGPDTVDLVAAGEGSPVATAGRYRLTGEGMVRIGEAASACPAP